MTVRIDRAKIVNQAEKYIKAGKIREAISEYEKIIAADPHDVGTLNIIGDLFVRLEQPDKAVEMFLKGAGEYEKRGLFSQALAICKKIYKISPENPEFSLKLAGLYAQQGFTAEAKEEYLRLANQYIRDRNPQEAIRVFEKIVRMNRDDLDVKRKLSQLYRDNGNLEAGLEQLNEIAELQLIQEKYEAAEKTLEEARALNPKESKTLVNLVEVYKRQNQSEKAIGLIEDTLKQTPDNVLLLNILGNFYFEKSEFQRAEEIFTSIVDNHPTNVNARIKLGRIQILKDKLDQAFDLFEPLISNLVKKHKDEKAIGLLGLILESQKPHLPALERLAAIYRANKETKKLEVVNRTILDELRKEGAQEKMITVLSEIHQIRPEDEEISKEYSALRQSLGIPEEDVYEDTVELSEKDNEMIEETMAQADLYMQQGLVRNARRILENLRLRYPDVPKIMKKIAVLDEIRTHIDEDELRRRVEKATAMESKIKEKTPTERTLEKKKERPVSFPDDGVEGDKVSTADIFAETDIIPFMTNDDGERKYYELKDQIAVEVQMLQAAYKQQSEGEMTQFERELGNIVADFKKDLKSKISMEDAETHYQLGIAFMEQGLYTEAIEELIIASDNKAFSLDCFSAMSYSHRQKKNFADAEKWLRKAFNLAKEGSDQYYALAFDLAELWEEAEEKNKALPLFKEIQRWNPTYRGVSAKIDLLEKGAGTQSA